MPLFNTAPPKIVARQSDAQLAQKLIKDRAQKRQIENDAISFKHYNRFSKLCDLPKPGEQWRIITEKQFNAFDLITWLLIDAERIDEMYIAVYRINESTVNNLTRLLDSGKVGKAYFVISSFFAQTKRPEQWALQLRNYCQDHPDVTKHVYAHNHAKVFCCRTAAGDNYVLEGSGNMSDNARIEQYLFENNAAAFDFHKGWIAELCERKRPHADA